ncbi:hypothetical protein Aple_028390 [Acrocarpospora pleiomorpha]|uniref:Uncharacterized protein n=1 Tax=Acrocarpospora pleiomorpha TaxID=90975 RepID=A0A5M3XLB8_9ACTN|nr:hypothetical protein Aple_028390 [Acrocarpospora pleiomorpha]
MDVDIHLGIPDRIRAGRHHRAFPPLRITEEELHHIGVPRGGVGQRIILIDVSSDTHHKTERIRALRQSPCFPHPDRPDKGRPNYMPPSRAFQGFFVGQTLGRLTRPATRVSRQKEIT